MAPHIVARNVKYGGRDMNHHSIGKRCEPIINALFLRVNVVGLAWRVKNTLQGVGPTPTKGGYIDDR